MTRIFDSHCHIYPVKIAQKAIESVDHFYGGLPGCPHDGTAETLLACGTAEGISHFIVHSVATRPEQVLSINRFISESVERAKGAFTGLGAIHPDADCLREDFEQLTALGLKGVKIHPDFQRFEADSIKAFRLYELAEACGLPILIHTGDHRYDYSNPERMVRVLRAFPGLRFIGAHLGGWSVWDRAEALLPAYPNFWVDTSSSFHWLGPERTLRIIRAFGADRVLFGTDYPMWPQKPEIDFLRSLPLTEEEKEQILWKNAAALYPENPDSRPLPMKFLDDKRTVS